jgi:superfamily II DNA/RNA helicase
MAEGNLSIGDVQFLVIDEADTMLDSGFGPELFTGFIKPLRRRNEPCATVLVCASMSAAVRAGVKAEFPEMKTAETSTLHKGIVGSNHVFVPMPPGSNRLDILARVRCLCVQARHALCFWTCTLRQHNHSTS